ncbi:MAG: 4-hydroxy-tetrahydrodipicolinate synthase [Bacteroidetes bacterium]|nr:MAG: 4-hydroxy-tetrahydrodipicolinate synthase [Bacteroidota bacterium]
MTTLWGLGVALVTPFKNDYSVDYEALEQIINYTISGGVQYLVTLGTTGETATLSTEEKLSILDFTYKTVNGRVPVVVGIGSNHTAEVLDCLKHWPLEAAAAVLSVSPYYNKPSQEGIFQHYSTLAAQTTKPVLLYNVPGRTGSNISAATTLRLARSHTNVVGIKEASGNMTQAMQLLKDRPLGFLLISGDDMLTLPLMTCGFNGVISVIGNCFPSQFSQLVQAALAGNLPLAQQWQFKLLNAMDLLFVENNPAGVKAFLAAQGLCKNVLRLPLVPLSAGYYADVEACLAEI